MTGGTRAATEGSKAWGEALEAAYRSDAGVRLFALAIIENLPRFVPRSLVKGQMGKDSASTPMLIDWDGKSKALMDASRGSLPHVWVFDRRGHLRLRVAAELTDENLRALQDAIGGLT